MRFVYEDHRQHMIADLKSELEQLRSEGASQALIGRLQAHIENLGQGHDGALCAA